MKNYGRMKHKKRHSPPHPNGGIATKTHKFSVGDIIESTGGLYKDKVLALIEDGGYVLEKLGPLPLNEYMWKLVGRESRDVSNHA